MRRIAMVIGAAMAIAVLGAVPVSAESLGDGNDLVGVFDLKTLGAVHDGTNAPMDVTIGFWDAFAVADLANAAGNVVKVQWDVDQNGTADFWGRIRKTGAVLSIAIQEGGSNRFEPLPVTRVGTRTLALTIPGDAPMNPTHEIAIRVVVKTAAGKDRTRWLDVGTDGSGGSGSGSGGSGGTPSVPANCRAAVGAEVTVVASGSAFTEGRCIRVDADAPFTIRFDNRDQMSIAGQHNITIFPSQDDLTTVLFRGELFGGPAIRSYAVPALAQGTYFFHCDVHPNMTGKVVAIEA